VVLALVVVEAVSNSLEMKKNAPATATRKTTAIASVLLIAINP